MPITVAVLCIVAVGSIPAARLLAAARWPSRSPATAIVLWQALGLGWGLATVGALAGLATAWPGQDSVVTVASRAGAGLLPAAGTTAAVTAPAGTIPAAISEATRLLTGGPGPGARWDVVTVLRIAALAAAAALLALLCGLLAAAIGAVLRARHRQRTLLRLLAHGDPKVPGALVVDHPAAAAYCVPGLRSAIVISAGTLELLDNAELAAVLAHERAHLRERHDLVLLPFTALLRAFGWSRTAMEANRAVALLVEMLADDHALRRRGARQLATALLRVGAAGGGIAPKGALAISASGGGGTAGAPLVTGGAVGLATRVMRASRASRVGRAGARRARQGRLLTDGELAVRVARLLRPEPRLNRPALALASATAIVVVTVPMVLLTLPV